MLRSPPCAAVTDALIYRARQGPYRKRKMRNAADPGSRGMVLSGPPGVGKSRLAERPCVWLSRAGTVPGVLWLVEPPPQCLWDRAPVVG